MFRPFERLPKGQAEGPLNGRLNWSGSTVGAHDVCIPMMIRHDPDIVSPWVGNEVSVDVRHQPADLSAL